MSVCQARGTNCLVSRYLKQEMIIKNSQSMRLCREHAEVDNISAQVSAWSTQSWLWWLITVSTRSLASVSVPLINMSYHTSTLSTSGIWTWMYVYDFLFPRFKSLSSPRVELSLVGIFIATSSSSLPYLHTSGYFSSIVDASNALDAMGKYYFYDRSNLPQYDLIVALTAQDMAAYKSGSYNTNTAGFAYVGGACVKNSRWWELFYNDLSSHNCLQHSSSSVIIAGVLFWNLF